MYLILQDDPIDSKFAFIYLGKSTYVQGTTYQDILNDVVETFK